MWFETDTVDAGHSNLCLAEQTLTAQRPLGEVQARTAASGDSSLDAEQIVETGRLAVSEVQLADSEGGIFILGQ